MKFFWSPLLVLLVVSTANAKDNGWWKNNANGAQASSRERVSRGPASSISLTTAPSIIVGDGAALPGVNLQVAGRIVREVPLNFTFDVGPYFYTSVGFHVVVPILMGMEYEFQLPANPKIRPLFGVNLGPVVGKRVVFGMLFRPGVNVQIARDLALNFEPRMGVFASSFVFVPQFGVRFSL